MNSKQDIMFDGNNILALGEMAGIEVDSGKYHEALASSVILPSQKGQTLV